MYRAALPCQQALRGPFPHGALYAAEVQGRVAEERSVGEYSFYQENSSYTVVSDYHRFCMLARTRVRVRVCGVTCMCTCSWAYIHTGG